MRRSGSACPPSRPILTSHAPTDRPYAAFLFDMDGTLLSSIAAAVRVWAR